MRLYQQNHGNNHHWRSFRRGFDPHLPSLRCGLLLYVPSIPLKGEGNRSICVFYAGGWSWACSFLAKSSSNPLFLRLKYPCFHSIPFSLLWCCRFVRVCRLRRRWLPRRHTPFVPSLDSKAWRAFTWGCCLPFPCRSCINLSSSRRMPFTCLTFFLVFKREISSLFLFLMM